jgi:hypothetical protein
VLHLATRIPPADRRELPGAWDANDRLRAYATRLLVDGALASDAALIVVPTAAFVYPPGPADESTPLADVPVHLRSALEAEDHLSRFNEAGRRGVALRLGSLYMDLRPLRPRRPTVTTLTCTPKMRVVRSWRHWYARAGSTTSAMTPMP